MKMYAAILLTLLSGVFPLSSQAQPNCQPPKPLPLESGKVIFTEEQEVDLGDVVAEQFQHEYRVIEDEELTKYLTQIGERIIKHFPPTKLRFQFFVVDLPEINAFALPGGRVYVTRKLIAFVQNEDELASVIGHEMGHQLARHGALEMSYIFKKLLKISELKNRQDVFDKFNQYIETRRLKPEVFAKVGNHQDKDQMQADNIGIFAAASAGYDPEAFVRFFDRLAETKGKKGNFFTDIFGATSPDSKRLREMTKQVTALPPDCKERRLNTAEAFRAWQMGVPNYLGLGRKESLHAVKARVPLTPALRSDMTHLRFSPNGQFILAQDESGIVILTREPLLPLFRIEAEDAFHAQFSPDSAEVSFLTHNLRVQIWSLAEQSLKSAHELLFRRGCVQASLSPTGKVIACLGGEKSSLTLYDVATQNQIYSKENVQSYNPFWWHLRSSRFGLEDDDDEPSVFDPATKQLKFSPDGRYLATGHGGGMVIDVSTRKELPLQPKAQTLLGFSFTFIAPDQIIGLNREDVMKSGLIALPAGDVIKQMPVYRGNLEAPTRGPFLLVRPVQKMAVGVLSLEKGEIFKASKLPAMDIYDNYYIAERMNGQIGLYTNGKKEALAWVNLPPNPLGQMRASALSPDFKYLAISGKTRGGVWDLTQGKLLYMMPKFRGAHLTGNALTVDYPKIEEKERGIYRSDLVANTGAPGPVIKEKFARQYGSVIVQPQYPKDKNGIYQVILAPQGSYFENLTLDVFDAWTLAPLWSKNYPNESPQYWVNQHYGTMTLAWPLAFKTARNDIKNDPALKQQLEKNKEKEGDYLVHVLDLRTGQSRGKLLIETGKGSFRINSIASVGDWVILSDSENRVLVYSLSTGVQRGKTFGKVATLSPTGKLLCVENEPGKLKVYDLTTMAERDQFSFSYPVSMMRFSPDGRSLFVLTNNQTAYVLDMATLIANVER